MYQMMTEGTELTLVMRKMSVSRMAVSLLPKVQTLKESTRNRFVPLVLNGTPAELDAGFFPAVAQPVQRAAGIMLNLAEFEKQTEKAAAGNKPPKPAAKEKETKEAKEKRERYEKYMRKAEEQMTAQDYGGATFSFQQARLLADAGHAVKIDEKIAAAKAAQSQNSLFDVPAAQTAPSAPVIPVTAPAQPASPVPHPIAQTRPVPPQSPAQPVNASPQSPLQAPPMSYPAGGYPQQPLPPMPQYEHTYPGVNSPGMPLYDNPDNPPTYRPEEYDGYVDFPQGMVEPQIRPMAQ